MDPDDVVTAANLLVVIIVAAATIMTRRTSLRRRHGNRRVWVTTLLSQRNNRGSWNALIPDLEFHGNQRGTFTNYFRMNEDCFQVLLNKVAPLITHQDTVMRPAIPPQQRLAVTLRYLASGCTFTELQYNFRISVSLLTNLIPETCQAIYDVLKEEYLSTPSTPEQWKAISTELYESWQFPNGLGALDGKHVVMQKPWSSGSYYHNYKGTESIVLMAMCDANYK